MEGWALHIEDSKPRFLRSKCPDLHIVIHLMASLPSWHIILVTGEKCRLCLGIKLHARLFAEPRDGHLQRSKKLDNFSGQMKCQVMGGEG